jgi:hypothetical protein
MHVTVFDRTAAASERCKVCAAGVLDRLLMERQDGTSLLAQHLLPAQEKLQQSPELPGPPALLPLLLNQDAANAAEQQPEQLPHAVEMYLRERWAALEQKQRRMAAQQEMGQQQQLKQDAEHAPAPDVSAHMGCDAESAPLSPSTNMQHAKQHDQPPHQLSSPRQSAARASGVFARPKSSNRHIATGSQAPAGTQHNKEQV